LLLLLLQKPQLRLASQTLCQLHMQLMQQQQRVRANQLLLLSHRGVQQAAIPLITDRCLTTAAAMRPAS
jgi:hypothetical protein